MPGTPQRPAEPDSHRHHARAIGRAADSAAWVRLMAFLLAWGWRLEIWGSATLPTTQSAANRDLWPDEPEDAPTTMAMRPECTTDNSQPCHRHSDIFPEAIAPPNEWNRLGITRHLGQAPLGQ